MYVIYHTRSTHFRNPCNIHIVRWIRYNNNTFCVGTYIIYLLVDVLCTCIYNMYEYCTIRVVWRKKKQSRHKCYLHNILYIYRKPDRRGFPFSPTDSLSGAGYAYNITIITMPMKTYRTIIKGSSTVVLSGSDSPRERWAFVYTQNCWRMDGRDRKGAGTHKHAVCTHSYYMYRPCIGDAYFGGGGQMQLIALFKKTSKELI